MSDDAPRSTQGNRPDQRRGRGAPAWWAMLQRNDLPDDPRGYDGAVETAQWDVSDGFPGRPVRRGRLATIASVLAAMLVALAVAVGVWAATAAAGRTTGLTVALVAGVPGALLVAALLAGLAGRRRRR